MADDAQVSRENIEELVLVALAVVAILFTVGTVYVLLYLTHNFYVSSYYASSVLFGVIGVDESATLISVAPEFSTNFYILIALSILDGVVKVVVIGFIIASLIDLVSSIGMLSKVAELGRARLRNHVVVCGYSTLAQRVCASLKERNKQFIVVDRDKTMVDMASEAGYQAIHEDFTRKHVLTDARIEKADAVLFLARDDYQNLLGVVTAASMKKGLKIIARSNDKGSVNRFHRAGASLCVIPEALAGLDLSESIMTKV